MTLDIMIDEQLLAINAELRAENEQLKKNIEIINRDRDVLRKDCDTYFIKCRDALRERTETRKANDELRETIQFLESQRNAACKCESSMRDHYAKLKKLHDEQSEDYNILLIRYHNLKREVETLRGMVKPGEVLND